MDPKDVVKLKSLISQMQMIVNKADDAEDAADGGADEAEEGDEEDDNGISGKMLAMKMSKYK